MSGTDHWCLLDLCWSAQCIWQGQQRRLWRIMTKYGCPEKFNTIVWQFYDGIHARVQDNGESCVVFPVTNVVKQGCVLASTLFSIMLFDAFSGVDNGIDIRYHSNDSVFNLRRLQAKTKVNTDIVNEFLFADDYALNATIKANMQNSVDKFSIAWDNFFLTISTKKTEVMHQPASRKPPIEPNITIKGQRLKIVEKFTYLGSTLSKSIVIDAGVNTRLTKASAAFGRLNRHLGGNQNQGIPSCRSCRPPLWLWNNLSATYKEAKPLSHNLSKEDSRHHMAKTHLRYWSLLSIYTILMQSRLHWTGHFVCMKDHRHLKKLLYGELSLRASAPKEARKSASKTHWSSPWNLSVSPRIAWNIWHKTETSDVKWKSVKPEET